MDEILSMIGMSSFSVGLLAGLYGWSKASWLRREDFRWDVDLDRARNRIRRATAVVVAWLCAIGTAFVSMAHFLKP